MRRSKKRPRGEGLGRNHVWGNFDINMTSSCSKTRTGGIETHKKKVEGEK